MLAFRTIQLRKFLWLWIVCLVVVVSVIIIPIVPTPRPAVDSKVLALRVLLGGVGLLAAINWPLLCKKRRTITDGIYLGLISGFVLSTLFSSHILYSLSYSWHLLALIICSWVITRIQPTPSEVRGLLWMVGGVTFLASLYGFLTYIGADILKPLYPFSFEENQGGRNFIHSFFGNPEYYAGFAAPGAVILWGLSIQSGSIRLKSRLAWLSATVAVFLVMILSGSRSALAGSFTGALIVALGQLRLAPIRLKRIALVSAIGAIAVISSGLFVLSTPNALNPKDMRLLQRFAATFDTQSDSVRERVIFYTSTASAIPRNPIFGSGPGGFRLDFIENVAALSDQLSPGVSTAMLNDISKGLAEHAHNDYLEIWFDQGTLGLGVFFMLIVYGAVSFVRTRHCIKLHGFTPSLAISCHLTIFAALTTMFINALTSFPFQMPARATLAWVLIGSFFALDYALGEACRVASGNSFEITETREKVEGD